MNHPFLPDHDTDAMPSMATLERYVSGGMSKEESDRMEAIIANDPFVADVVEGIRMSQGDVHLPARLARIRERVHLQLDTLPEAAARKSRRRGRVKPFPQFWAYTAIAASLALILLFVGILRDKEVQPAFIAANEAPASQEPEDLSAPSDSKSADATASTLGPGEWEEETEEDFYSDQQLEDDMMNLGQSAPGSDPSDDWRLDELLAEGGESELEEDFDELQEIVGPTSSARASSPLPGAPKAIPSTSVLTDSNTNGQRYQLSDGMAAAPPSARSGENKAMEAPSRKEKERSEPFSVSGQAPSPQQAEDKAFGEESKAAYLDDLLLRAITAYELGDATGAETILEELLLSDSENAIATYYLGQSLLKQGKIKAGISWLEKTMEQSDSSVYFEAQWALAEAYLQDGKTRKAKVLFRNIAGVEGPFQQKAQEQLDSLE